MSINLRRSHVLDGPPVSHARETEEQRDARAILAALGILGSSSEHRDLVRQVTLATRAPGGVLITGEPGSGHEQIARAIHAAGRPAAAPFVAVCCHKPDPAQLEHDLFGAPPARRPRDARDEQAAPATTPEPVSPGSLLSRARGGTIFFSGLEELPDRLQARLALALRDREEYVALSGHQRRVSLDVRPMAAGESDFQRDVAEGRVRMDLAHRFAGTRIAVPALRDRREDIQAIAMFYLDEAALERNVPARNLTGPAATLLTALPWKGNVRELRDLVERLVSRTVQQEIGLEDVLDLVQLETLASAPGRASDKSGTLRQARQQFEREYITAVLAQHHGRIPDAARALGLQRTNLYRKLRTLQLPRTRTKSPAAQA